MPFESLESGLLLLLVQAAKRARAAAYSTFFMFDFIDSSGSCRAKIGLARF
jgi:hypothetical protein